MGHQENGRSFDHADRLPTEFILHNAILADENAWIVKDFGCDLEPDAVFAEVGLSLFWIPSKADHERQYSANCVAT
jgi:hypothetical protein